MGDRTPRRMLSGTASATTTPVSRRLPPMSVQPSASCPASPDTPARIHPSMTGPPCPAIEDSGRIRVVTRMRQVEGESEPMKGISLTSMEKGVELTISETWPEKVYDLDAFYTADDSPSDVFAKEVEPIISRVVAGFNATVFAYGPTGSGKTYLMQGSDQEDGLIQKTASWLLSGKYAIKIKLAYYELYCDKVVDLNTGARLTILETADGTECINGLTQMPLSRYSEFQEAFGAATERRKTGSTNINATSSRSHAILEITCWDFDFKHQLGKLRLLDLAGSENNSYTGNRSVRLQESCWINESLFFLGRVIEDIAVGQKKQMRLQRLQASNSGADGTPQAPRTQIKSGRRSSIGHIGYRSSKLTRVLKDTLGGDSQAVMIACLKPNNLPDTLRVLALAAKSRQIQKPREEVERPKQTAANQREAQQSLAEQLEAWKAQRAAASPGPSFTSTATHRVLMSRALDAGGRRNVPMSLPRPPRPSLFQPRTCLQNQPDPVVQRSQHAPVRKLAFGHVAPGMAHKPGDKAPTSAHKWQNLGTGASPSWIRGTPSMRGEPLSTILSPAEHSAVPPATEGRVTRSGRLSMGLPQSIQRTRSGSRQSLAVSRLPPIVAHDSPKPVPFEVEYSAPSDSDAAGYSVARSLGSFQELADGPPAPEPEAEAEAQAEADAEEAAQADAAAAAAAEAEAEEAAQADAAAVAEAEAEAEAEVQRMGGAGKVAASTFQENVAPTPGSPFISGATTPGGLSLVTPGKGLAADSLLALGALGAQGHPSSAAPPSAGLRRSPRNVPVTPNVHMASTILTSLGLGAHPEAATETPLDREAVPSPAGPSPWSTQHPESSPFQQEASGTPRRSPVQNSPFQAGSAGAQFSRSGTPAAAPAPSPDTYWLTGPSDWAQQTGTATETEAEGAPWVASTAGAEGSETAEEAGPGPAFEFPVDSDGTGSASELAVETGFSFPVQSPTRATRASPRVSLTPTLGLNSFFSPTTVAPTAGAAPASPTVSIRRTLEGVASVRSETRRSMPGGGSPSPRGLKERSPSQINKLQTPSLSPSGKKETQVLSPAASLLAGAPQTLLPSSPTLVFQALTVTSPSGPSSSPLNLSPTPKSPKAPTPPRSSSRAHPAASPKAPTSVASPIPAASPAQASVPEASPKAPTPRRSSTPRASPEVPTPAASPAQASVQEASPKAPAAGPSASPKAQTRAASPQTRTVAASPLTLVPEVSSPAPGPSTSPVASLAAPSPQERTAASSPLILVPPASLHVEALVPASTPVGAAALSRRPAETPVTRQKKVFKDVIAEEILAKLNEAPEEELIASFKGVGPVYAKKIVAERANAAAGEVAFKSVLDLTKIGMAQKRIETLKTAYYTATMNKDDDGE